MPEERRFTGLDAYQKAIESGVDMVLLCTPPGFRPMQFEAAVKAGKHVFMEKPLATDAPGVRRIMAANEEAKKKKLAVAVGHHLRHETKYREIVKRIHDGAIGELKFLRAYFNSTRRLDPPAPAGPDGNAVPGPQLVLLHLAQRRPHRRAARTRHRRLQLDCQGSIPWRPRAWAAGRSASARTWARSSTTTPSSSPIADGPKMFSYCRHIPGCWDSFSEHAHGTKGIADLQGYGNGELCVAGQAPARWKRGPDGHQVEMDDLFAALLAGQPYNEADWAAESTMTAILGRMATYSGKVVKWDEAIKSQLDLAPKNLAWDAETPVKPGPDGIYACAIPGVTKAW